MVKKEILVGTSLVERPVHMMVQTAGRYSSEIKLAMDDKEINLKSIMGVISIGTLTDQVVTITAHGSDEGEALDAIVEFLS